jgi:hypothetical protein
MNSNSNHYEVLGVDIDATTDEIKQAYRRLVKIYHPDHNPSEEATAMFRRIQEAYENLMDTKLREYYDEKIKSSKASFTTPTVPIAQDISTKLKLKFYVKGLWQSLFIAGMLGVSAAYLFYFLQFPFGFSVLRHSLLHPLEYSLNLLKSNSLFSAFTLTLMFVFFVLAYLKHFRRFAGEYCIILFIAFGMICTVETLTGNGSLLLTDSHEQQLFSYAESGRFEENFATPVSKIKYSKRDSTPYIEEVGVYNGLHYFVRLNGDGAGSLIGQGKKQVFKWN